MQQFHFDIQSRQICPANFIAGFESNDFVNLSQPQVCSKKQAAHEPTAEQSHGRKYIQSMLHGKIVQCQSATET
jgi:hypothetical protein